MSSIGTVVARLTLDSAQFDEAMKRAAENSTASGRARAKAAELAAKAEALSAKLGADAVNEQTIRIVQARKMENDARRQFVEAQRLAKTGSMDEEAALKLVGAALERLAAAKLAVAEASKVQAAGEEAAGHAAVSQMAATSAAVRSLDGNPGIRAVERFLTTIPGVGQALTAAFPLIGGIAFGGMVVGLGKKLYDFMEQGREAASQLEAGFEQVQAATRMAGIDLDLVNDKLVNQLAVLNKKPENLLKLALDEDRKAAADLVAKLQEAKDKVDALLQSKGVSFWDEIGYALTGHNLMSTDGDKDFLAAQADARKRAAIDAQNRLDNATPGQADLFKKANAANMSLLLKQQTAALKARLEEVYSDQRDPLVGKEFDYSARTSVLEGGLADLKGQVYNHDAANQVGDNTAAVKTAEQRKQDADDARRQAEERKRQRAEQLRDQMEAAEQQLDALKADHELQQGEEYVFWQRMQQTAAQGSALWLAIQKKMAPAFQEWMRQLDEGAKRIEEHNAKYAAMIREWDEVAGRGLDEIDKAAAAHAAAQRRIDDILEKNALSVEKLRIAEGMRSGQITKMAAAQQLAAATARSYADELARLERQLKALQSYQGADKQEKIDSTNEKIAATQGQLAEANLQVGYAAGGQPGSAIVGVIDAFDRMAQAANRLDDIIGSLADSIENGLNQQFVRALSGQRTDFSNTAAGFFRQASGSALKYGEGKLLGALGFGGGGKPTGTPGDPYYIRNADGAPGGAGGSSSVQRAAATGFKGFLQKVFGLNSGNGGSTAAAGSDADDADMSGFDMSAFDTIPFMAQGGLLTANSMAIVGERGPELFMPGTSGTIVPNSKLRGGNVTHHHTWNIDARGATDPAAVRRMVMQGITAAAPQLAGMSVAAMKDYQRRIPSSKR